MTTLTASPTAPAADSMPGQPARPSIRVRTAILNAASLPRPAAGRCQPRRCRVPAPGQLFAEMDYGAEFVREVESPHQGTVVALPKVGGVYHHYTQGRIWARVGGLRRHNRTARS
jgi:hypothetical protein